MGFRKKGAKEIVWGPEEPWQEPKKEIILGPAGNESDLQSSESALGFLGTMASAGETSNTEIKPEKSPYGWEPDSSSLSSSDSSSEYNSSDSDMTDKMFRLQRKIDNLVERLEILERKIRKTEYS